MDIITTALTGLVIFFLLAISIPILLFIILVIARLILDFPAIYMYAKDILTKLLRTNEMTIATCHSCAEIKNCILSMDPLISEVFPEDLSDHTKEWWCDNCYETRADDI